MGVFEAMLGAFRAADVAPSGAPPDYMFRPLGQATLSGISVTPTSSLEHSATWAAIDRVATGLAHLPLITYKRLTNGGKERAFGHPLYDLFATAPNPYQTAFTWKRVMMVHALAWGNAYGLKVPGPRGATDTIMPLYPDNVKLERIPGGYRYRLREDDGVERTVNAEDVFHIRGLSLNGVAGLNVIQYARETIGLGIAARKHQASLLGRGTRLGGLLKKKGKLSADAQRRLELEFELANAGLAGTGKTIVLEEDMDWVQTGMTSEDAQVVGSLQWSLEESARIFNVPLHLLQHTTKSTSWGSGIAELSLGFVTFTLAPWAVNWQDQIRKDLIVAPYLYTAEFLFDALLRGNTLERYQANQIAAGGMAPWATRNEIRIRENMNPIDGLDDVLQPAAMGVSGQGTGQPSTAKQTDPAEDDEVDALGAGLDMFIHSNVARLVRREVAGAAKVLPLGRQAVADFYDKHARVLADALMLEPADAEGYCAGSAHIVIDGGLASDDYEAAAVDSLAAIVRRSIVTRSRNATH